MEVRREEFATWRGITLEAGRGLGMGFGCDVMLSVPWHCCSVDLTECSVMLAAPWLSMS